MTKVQTRIDDMHKGNIKAITNGVSSRVPIVALNAILTGTQRNLHDPVFIEGVKQAEESNEILLGIPLKSLATASLHLLGEKKYVGDDKLIITMIDSKMKM